MDPSGGGSTFQLIFGIVSVCAKWSKQVQTMANRTTYPSDFQVFPPFFHPRLVSRGHQFSLRKRFAACKLASTAFPCPTACLFSKTFLHELFVCEQHFEVVLVPQVLECLGRILDGQFGHIRVFQDVLIYSFVEFAYEMCCQGDWLNCRSWIEVTYSRGPVFDRVLEWRIGYAKRKTLE